MKSRGTLNALPLSKFASNREIFQWHATNHFPLSFAKDFAMIPSLLFEHSANKDKCKHHLIFKIIVLIIPNYRIQIGQTLIQHEGKFMTENDFKKGD